MYIWVLIHFDCPSVCLEELVGEWTVANKSKEYGLFVLNFGDQPSLNSWEPGESIMLGGFLFSSLSFPFPPFCIWKICCYLLKAGFNFSWKIFNEIWFTYWNDFYTFYLVLTLSYLIKRTSYYLIISSNKKHILFYLLRILSSYTFLFGP